MFRNNYEDYLCSLGYHGTYVRRDTESLEATFWKDEYKIALTIRCRDDRLPVLEQYRTFLKVLRFAETEMVRNISAEDDIEGILREYLLEQASFDSVQPTKPNKIYFPAIKGGVEYRICVSVHTEEDHSSNKYDEDHNVVLEVSRNELAKLLEDKGVYGVDIELAHDFLSVKGSICYNHKNYHIDIHAFYNDYFYMWQLDAADIIRCCWDALTDCGALHINKYEEYLEKCGFFEIESSSDGRGRIKVTAYCGSDKFGIEISSEDEVIPFDNMEGHEFEFFFAEVLAKNGFEDISVTKGSGDQGVDILAYKDDVKYGFQCKCYAQDVGNKAVQEVFAGKTYHQCHVGVVVTNRYFTRSAIKLAKRSGVILWDRDKLLQMVDKYNESNG